MGINKRKKGMETPEEKILKKYRKGYCFSFSGAQCVIYSTKWGQIRKKSGKIYLALLFKAH